MPILNMLRGRAGGAGASKADKMINDREIIRLYNGTLAENATSLLDRLEMRRRTRKMLDAIRKLEKSGYFDRAFELRNSTAAVLAERSPLMSAMVLLEGANVQTAARRHGLAARSLNAADSLLRKAEMHIEANNARGRVWTEITRTSQEESYDKFLEVRDFIVRSSLPKLKRG